MQINKTNNPQSNTTQPLEGLKIADFSWAIAGPLATRILADYGATVIRVESMKRPDILRAGGPYAKDTPGIDMSGGYAKFNSNKYSLRLDIASKEGLKVAKKLIAWSDVVVENFRTGTMDKLGLGYAEAEKIRPGIIMISSSMQGQTGPHAAQVGYGTMLQALSGITNIVGWPDREPVGVSVPYTDFVTPYYMIVALLSSLEYRRKTGKGQFIDLSQFEAGATFLSPAILDYFTNNKVAERSGNSDRYAAPHGVYKCTGDDRWIAIAVTTDEEWTGFCSVLKECSWVKEAKFSTLSVRKQHEDELNRLVEDWTAKRSAKEIMLEMQSAGVPCGMVQDARDVAEDPQLNGRHYFQQMDHPEMGPTVYYAPPFILSKTPNKFKMPSPCLGQHTEFVCTQILKMSDQEFIDSMQSGAFE